ncbi:MULTISPECIES: SDR family NAD(P)-dependent oxidoreductase [Paenibacillus]|uniref:SDR family NAD(P)-dependent oxidoreductase n=1 Tax=Paenibacillus TaxID=44249 RepID=UPI00073E58AF|nr:MULTISPECIES: SDR family NAD(P)-dependent oxidoreductase [Paenibacillus]MDU4694634.1 SDR family NAD(P)-dependent oxidoreductase [Paenibacillus sp.]
MTMPKHLELQKPIFSGFGPRTTALDVISGLNLEGKNAIVTGGYSGLGLEAVKALASAGATIIVPTRNLDKAREALKEIPKLELEQMDLMDPVSIDEFANRFIASDRPLHILINSAGVMASPLVRDSRGYESQLATNHLGHFHLVLKLWPALKRGEGARVVSVSSRALQLSAFDFEDPHFNTRDYDKWIAYAQSKTANALFAVGLDKRGKAHGVRAFSVHPGTIAETDLARYLSEDELRAMGALNERGERAFAAYTDEIKTMEEGAATIVWCAAHPQLDGMGGVYCENGDIAGITDTPHTPGVSEWAVNEADADRLWTLSEQLIGIKLVL